MPYWFINKKTDVAEIFGNISAIIRNQKLEKIYSSRLYEVFSRKKLQKYEDEIYRIEKKQIIS